MCLVGLRGRAAPPPCRDEIVRMVFLKFFFHFFFFLNFCFKSEKYVFFLVSLWLFSLRRGALESL